jgi:hypothetical protein
MVIVVELHSGGQCDGFGNTSSGGFCSGRDNTSSCCRDKCGNTLMAYVMDVVKHLIR